jgi:hypothetical protein
MLGVKDKEFLLLALISTIKQSESLSRYSMVRMTEEIEKMLKNKGFVND